MLRLALFSVWSLFCISCASAQAPVAPTPDNTPPASQAASPPAPSADDPSSCKVEEDTYVYTLGCTSYDVFTERLAFPLNLPAPERAEIETSEVQRLKDDPDVRLQGEPQAVLLNVEGGRSVFNRYVVISNGEPYAHYIGWSSRRTARMHTCVVPEQTPDAQARKICGAAVDHMADYAMLRRPDTLRIQGRPRSLPKGCTLGDQTVTCFDPEESFISWTHTSKKAELDDAVQAQISSFTTEDPSQQIRRTFPCYQDDKLLTCTSFFDLAEGHISYIASGEVSANRYTRITCTGPRPIRGSMPKICARFFSDIPRPKTPQGCTSEVGAETISLSCGNYAAVLNRSVLRGSKTPEQEKALKDHVQLSFGATSALVQVEETLTIGGQKRNYQRFTSPTSKTRSNMLFYAGFPQVRGTSWLQLCVAYPYTTIEQARAKCAPLLAQTLAHADAHRAEKFEVFGDKHTAPGCNVADARVLCLGGKIESLIWSETTSKATHFVEKMNAMDALNKLVTHPTRTFGCTHRDDAFECLHKRDPASGATIVFARWETREGVHRTLLCEGITKTSKPTLPGLCAKVLTRSGKSSSTSPAPTATKK